jgi:diguanylate cyclase (GGDEF)-like protein
VLTGPAIHPRDLHGASRAVAYLMAAVVPFLVVSVLLVPGFVGDGPIAVLNVAVVEGLLAVGAVVCWRYPHKLPGWFWVALPVIAAAGTAWMDLVTHDAGVTGLVFFLWPVLYAATFLRRVLVVGVLLAVLAAATAVTFRLLRPAVALSDVLALTTTLAMSAVIIVLLRERRDQLLAVLEGQALADPLTGLPNRRCFERDLAQADAWVRRTGLPLALLTVDVDHFKQINDTWGHHVGDQALQGVARALREAVRETDVVARLGGDEFVVLLRSDGTGANRVAQAVRDRVTVTCDLPGGPPTLSIGAAVLPDHADTVDVLRTASDAALYRAKVHGRDQVAWAGAG